MKDRLFSRSANNVRSWSAHHQQGHFYNYSIQIKIYGDGETVEMEADVRITLLSGGDNPLKRMRHFGLIN